MRKTGKLETISDEQGTIRMGWVGEGVLFAHFTGNISGIADVYKRALEARLSGHRSASVFCDAWNLEASVLAARTALTPFLGRKKGSPVAINILTRSRLVTLTAASFSLLHRAPIVVLHSRRKFTSLLKRATGDVSVRIGAAPEAPSAQVPKAAPTTLRSR